MKILLTGAGGILGTELRRIVAGDPLVRSSLPAPLERHRVVALARADLDVTEPEAVRRALVEHAPDAVIHCAAYTAVDRAESEPRLARAVNVEGTSHVARAAAEVGAVLLYPSTDFVFDGSARVPYPPDAPTGPASVYGRTKLEGEEAVRAVGGPSLVVRTSWVYGEGGGNFVDAILARARQGAPLRIVDDQTGRPTWARTLAASLLELLEKEARGVLHVADAGATTWYAFARAFLEMEGLAPDLTPVATEDYGAPAPRPRYSVLDTAAAEEVLGRPMTPWRDSVARYLQEVRAAD